MGQDQVEVIEDPTTGLYMEIEPAGSLKYDPDADEEGPGLKADADLPAVDAELAKKAAKALDAGGAARPDAGKPKGAANALLFHQWGDDKKDDG